jgi:predicted RNase H-like nuclease (RuvC/YqgF family)
MARGARRRIKPTAKKSDKRVNIMDLEDIETRIEVLEAGIIEQEDLIQKLRNDEESNNTDHSSNIKQAREEIRQLEMEIEYLKSRVNFEDPYEIDDLKSGINSYDYYED